MWYLKSEQFHFRLLGSLGYFSQTLDGKLQPIISLSSQQRNMEKLMCREFFSLTECIQGALAVFTLFYCYLFISFCTEIKFSNFINLERGGKSFIIDKTDLLHQYSYWAHQVPIASTFISCHDYYIFLSQIVFIYFTITAFPSLINSRKNEGKQLEFFLTETNFSRAKGKLHILSNKKKRQNKQIISKSFPT